MKRPLLQCNAERSLGAWIVPASEALKQALTDELAPHGVTGRQWAVLLEVVRDPEISQARLAERLGVEPPTLSGVLDRMERDGWISRAPNPQDRRRNRIRLEGRVDPIWRRITECAERVRERAARSLSKTELDELRRMLEIVRGNLEEPEA